MCKSVRLALNGKALRVNVVKEDMCVTSIILKVLKGPAMQYSLEPHVPITQ